MTPVTRGLPEVITAQTLFDKVATHLLTQGRPAATYGSRCLYRGGPDGSMSCAAGVLIPEDRYYPEMENKTVSSSVMRSALPELVPHMSLLSNLQWVHDDKANWINHPDGPQFDMAAVRRELTRVASHFELTVPAILEAPAEA